MSNDSLIFVSHPQYSIENVFVIPEAIVGNIKNASFTDTLKSKKGNLLFLLNKPLQYRELLFNNNINIYPDHLFKRDTAQKTYKQLQGVGTFKNVSIQFFPNRDKVNKLDCYVICNPLLKQSVTAESEGTNTSGNLGIDGTFP